MRRACKNTVEHKSEQVPLVGRCVYSGRGVEKKKKLGISPLGLSHCRTAEVAEHETRVFSRELILMFRLVDFSVRLGLSVLRTLVSERGR